MNDQKNFSETKNVLITGASTGIGYAIATHLAGLRYNVFAGARKKEDIVRLSEIEGITGIKLEVTNEENIQDAVNTLSNAGMLYGLINNAGMSGGATLLDMPIDQYQYQFEVNVFSHVRLFKAFFEQLKSHKGRIINISSIASFFSGGFGGAYFCTKHAVNQLSEQMQIETEKFGIHVSVVQPGFFHSSIFETSGIRGNKMKANTKYYAEDYATYLKNYNALKDANIKDPILVAERIAYLLKTESPPLHNVVGTRDEQTWVIQAMMERIKKINDGFGTPWTSEEFLKMFTDIFQAKE